MLTIGITSITALPAYGYDEYTTKHWIGDGGMILATGIDYLQTKQIAKHPDKFYEALNPYLGEHPSVSKVNGYFLGAVIVKIAVSHLISDAKWRERWQRVNIGWNVNNIAQNLNVGITIRY